MVTKTPAKSVVDPFAGLLETAEVVEKRSAAKFEGEVPPEWIARVESAYDKSERVTLKVTEKSVFESVSALLRAAGDKSDKNITVTCKAVYSGEGDDAVLTGLSFTVGNRRGQKPGKDKSAAATE